MKDRELFQMALEALEEVCNANILGLEFKPQYHQLITALRARLATPEPLPPPPECKTIAEKNAYAFGWWKALETARLEQPDLARVGGSGRVG